MRCLTIDVTLEEPVVCTQLDGEPNSARTYGFVPGSVLRGALAALYAAERGLTGDGALLSDPDARRTFFSGEVRYLNAYPVLDGERASPVSQAWFRDKQEHRQKGHEASIYDVFVAPSDSANKRVAGDDDAFAVRRGAQVRLHTAARQAAIHTMRDRVAGRARTGSGAVFRYEALAPRQTLRAHVLVSEHGAKILHDLIKDGATIMLGKSRTAGYGRAQVSQVSDRQLEEWSELGSSVDEAASGRTWRLTLLSDALLRDGSGRSHAGAEAMRTALVDALGDVLGDGPEAIDVQARYVTVRTVGGFNRIWGLPLSQASAARMGSEYQIACDGLTSEHARRLEQVGIGDRRSDGFGRVALRPAGGAATLQESKRESSPAAPKVLGSATPSAALAKIMVDRMLRRLLDRKVVEQALWISACVKRPTASQLKRLQAVVRDELVQAVRAGAESRTDGRPAESGSAARLKRYLDSVNQRPSVKRMFDAGALPIAARQDAPTVGLQEWLAQRFREDDAGIDVLLGISSSDMPTIGGVRASMTPSLRREYSLRLAHTVLGLAAKRLRRSEEERR